MMVPPSYGRDGWVRASIEVRESAVTQAPCPTLFARDAGAWSCTGWHVIEIVDVLVEAKGDA